MSAIRTFIALPSSPELKNALRKLQTSLIQEKADLKWDTPDKFHITVKFLGNVDLDRITELSDSLTTVTSRMTAFRLVYNAVGAFPDLVHPKVIWAGAEMNETLTSLHHGIELACARLGFPTDTRAFHPHITLGRVKGLTNLARLTAKVNSISFEPTETACSEVLLIKSELRPTGSVYTTLNSFPLKAQSELFHDRQ